MVRMTLTVKVQEGKEAEFETEWHKVADHVRTAPGHLRQTLLRVPDESATYVIMSDWETRDDFGKFERSPEQDELTAQLRDLRESASMRVDEIVTHIDAD